MGEHDKVQSAMGSRTLSAAISLVAFLGFSSALCAQRTKTPTLTEILDRLEANLNHYDADVPSLFCDEHAVSSLIEPGVPDQNTITDSVFRLKRVREPDRRTTLAETREIKTVDGEPATSQHMDGPTQLNGVFEGGLAVVSRNQTACMDYALQRINRNRPTGPYVVRFATVPGPQKSADCLLQEESSGRAFIDPASMQITHLEISTPRHTIASHLVGKRKVTVEYAPVLLGGETYWMPSVITMRNTSGFGFHMIVWSFRATYRNYHRLEVTSRILPGGGASAP